MKVKSRLPNNFLGVCILLPSLSRNNIKLLNSFHIATEGVIANQNQPIDLPYLLALEIKNQDMNMTVQLRKKQEVAFFTLLNEGTEEIRHKFIKTWRLNYYIVQFINLK